MHTANISNQSATGVQLIVVKKQSLQVLIATILGCNIFQLIVAEGATINCKVRLQFWVEFFATIGCNFRNPWLKKGFVSVS